MVTFERGIARLGDKSRPRMKSGTKMTPAPIPPPAAIIKPHEARVSVAKSRVSSGHSVLWYHPGEEGVEKVENDEEVEGRSARKTVVGVSS